MLAGAYPFQSPADAADADGPQQQQALALGVARMLQAMKARAFAPPEGVSAQCAALLARLLEPDESKRIRMEELTRDAWFLTDLPPGAPPEGGRGSWLVAHASLSHAATHYQHTHHHITITSPLTTHRNHITSFQRRDDHPEALAMNDRYLAAARPCAQSEDEIRAIVGAATAEGGGGGGGAGADGVIDGALGVDGSGWGSGLDGGGGGGGAALR